MNKFEEIAPNIKLGNVYSRHVNSPDLSKKPALIVEITGIYRDVYGWLCEYTYIINEAIPHLTGASYKASVDAFLASATLIYENG